MSQFMLCKSEYHTRDDFNIKISYEDDTELAEFEAFSRGYRRDVLVEIGDKKYQVEIISMVRLRQDFKIEQRDGGYYITPPNMLIVEDVTKEEIEKIVVKMYQCKYFERLGELK